MDYQKIIDKYYPEDNELKRLLIRHSHDVAHRALLIADRNPQIALDRAFVEEAAIQCGFCTPGFVLTAEEILEAGQEYTDEQLRKLLSGHLCRCTGYENILRAVRKTMLRRLGKEA